MYGQLLNYSFVSLSITFFGVGGGWGGWKIVICMGVACSQHFAGLLGGLVEWQDLPPGGLGGQLCVIK